MKKVAILAFQFADNFGALLQIYALSKIINKKDFFVEVIDFSPPELTEGYSLGVNLKNSLKNKGLFRTVRSLIYKVINFNKNLKRKRNFEEFRNRFLNITKQKYYTNDELLSANELKNYDYYIVGSDQVWNPAFYKYGQEGYFLNFAQKNSVKISYAASIAEELNDQDKVFFKNELKDFDYISVREESAKTQIKKLTEKEVYVTLDPTLLLTKNEWGVLIDEEKITEKFILVYDLAVTPTIIELANKISENMDAKIISYSDGKLYKNILYSFSGVNPKTFLQLIRDAEFVITSSFHGTAFSLIFEKDFYTVPHPTRGSRMIDLLTKLNLKKLLVTEIKDEPFQIPDVDYKHVNIQLEKMREESKGFIEKSLS